jgi:hypothetical protein
MEMVKFMLACALLPVAASAAGFSMTIGPPVAAGTGIKVVKSKGPAFAVRLEECDALETAQVSGAAEGVVDGEHRSAALAITPTGSPGVYLVSPALDQKAGDQTNQNQGLWVVSLTATCGKAKAGAIVPMGPQGFLREATKILPRAATKAEIEAALKGLEAPGK